MPKMKRRGSTSLVSELHAYEDAEAELRQLRQEWSDAISETNSQLSATITHYQAICSAILSRRDACIKRLLSSHPRAGKSLAEDSQYFMAVPERAMFRLGGITLVYMPDEGDDEPSPCPGRTSHQADGRSRAPIYAVAADSSSPDPLQSKQEPCSPCHVLSPPAETTGVAPPERDEADNIAARPSKHTKLHKDSLPSLRPEGLPTRKSPMVPMPSTLPDPRLRLRRTSKRRDPTVRPPVKLSTARKKNCWIFLYCFPRGFPSLYIMCCTLASCQHQIFSKNPLGNNRGAEHLRACGHKFKDDHDMVRRFAQLVVPDRPGGELRLDDVRKHNSSLLGANEQHLEVENV